MRGLGEEDARQVTLRVHVVEAVDPAHLLPARLGRPAESVGLPLGARRRLLPGAVGVLVELREEALEHLEGLGVLVPPRRSQLAVDVVRGEDRAVGVGQADPLHDLLHLLLVDPLRVGEEPDGHHGVGVEVVDEDLGVGVDHEAEPEGRRHLLTGRQGHQPSTARVVVERKLPRGRIDLGPLHGAVEGDRVGSETRELHHLSENKIDSPHCGCLL